MLCAFNQWGLVSHPPLVLITQFNKGPWAYELPFHGRMTTKQNCPGPWVDRGWIFRKQVRSLQWYLSPAWGLGRDAENTWTFPMLYDRSLSVPSSREVSVPAVSCSQLIPHIPLTKVYNSTTSQWSFKLTMGCSFPRERVPQFDPLYSSHGLGFFFYMWYFWHFWMPR